MTVRILSVLVSVSLLVACASQPIKPVDVTGPEIWGGADNVTGLRHLYFSSQPDAETLRIAKTRGVTAIIDLRSPEESDWDEKGAATKLGLAYANVPITRDGESLDPAALQHIEYLVRAQKGAPVLLHCGSGNRAAAWLAVHLVGAHDLERGNALAVAEKAGLNHAPTKARVVQYLKEQDR